MLHSLWVVTVAIFLFQRPPQVITLDRAIEIALETSERIRAAEAELEQADGERVRARSGLFPQLSSSVSYQRTLATEFSDVFTQSRDSGAADTAEDFDLPFGRENVWQLNLNLSQNLYSGGRIGALQDLAGAARQRAAANLETARGQVELEASEAYFDAAVTDLLVSIAESTVRQAEQTIRNVEAGFQAGAQPEFEVLRARVNRDNQIPILNRARANREIAYLRLKQLLELPQDEDIEVVAELHAVPLEVPSRYAARLGEIEAALRTGPAQRLPRTAIDAAEAAVELQQANVRSAAAERRFRITATSNYERVAYPSNVFTDFGDIRTNWTAGINVTLPLLTGGRQRGDEIVARAQLQGEKAQLALTRELAALDARTAYTRLVEAQSTLDALSGGVALARRAYEIAEIRFRAGVSTQLELSDARLQLEIAEANFAQSARDLQVARIRVALLPDLPIGSSPGSLSVQTPVQTPATSPALEPSSGATSRPVQDVFSPIQIPGRP